jgi:hypothetical protein
MPGLNLGLAIGVVFERRRRIPDGLDAGALARLSSNQAYVSAMVSMKGRAT